ncbi:heterokaryon incompatibility protein-domain-containing protein [Fusarium tricinctum]|uniref:Heterokaryon incompatibility protein-domain-containing protein n=1 Tax=Fusarium tricinctum TaxID=61284 RepID=A0A8K0RYZ5_9HYPO|nr:heterokaryon incompatibility protein-domain-containing protein [Fusarium tricinctum]
MWLLNTTTIELERADAATTSYAILSHTWSEDEVTFEDMIQTKLAKRKQGYSKIENTCRLARRRGIEYAWVDTCCVDKRSSAELTEAINSMFLWYKCSTVCFTHLEDLKPQWGDEDDSLEGLPSCRWFTRGWTLQELIASQTLEFYDCEWQYRGTKAELRDQISDITGIDLPVLENNALLESIPIAKRMSWAANRKTTRTEDMAYCLLGIFDVNMPMMYGEGTKAFTRLQEEIIKETTDLSVFAWKAQEGTDIPSQDFRGVLAQSPIEFVHCRNLSRAPSMRYGFEFSMTNKGLRLETYLAETHAAEYILNLACILPKRNGDLSRVGVYLVKTADGYVRTRPGELFETRDSRIWAGARYKIFIRKRISPFGSVALKNLSSTNLVVWFNICDGFKLHTFAAKPADLWDPLRQSFITDNNGNFTGFLDFQISDTSQKFVSARIFIVCGLRVHPGTGTMGPWMGVYNSLDKGSQRSQWVAGCIDDYYTSYGEEFYLHKLRERTLAAGVDIPLTTNIPCGADTGRLHISLKTPPVTGDTRHDISVNITYR